MELRNIRGTREYQDELEEGQVKAPVSIGDLMMKKFERQAPQNSEDKAKHERAYWVELTRKALGIHWKTKKEYTFGNINGLTRKWSIAEIRDRYLYISKHATCPFSMAWFGMIKQDKEKAKKKAEALAAESQVAV